MGDDHQKWRRTGMLRIIHLRGKSGKISLRIYEERENKVVLVAEDVVEYDQTPSVSKTGDHWAARVILDLSTSDKVAENGLAEFLCVSNWGNFLKWHCPINCVNEKLQGSVPVVFSFQTPHFFLRGDSKRKNMIS